MNQSIGGSGQSCEARPMTEEECAAEQVKRDSRTVRDEIDQRIASALNAAEGLAKIKLRTPAAILDLTTKRRHEMGLNIFPDVDSNYPF